MKLGELKAAPGSRKKRKRIGCGVGSGHGKTSCRGHKGQRCRSGSKTPPWFEGGQMPLQRRLPKRGFVNIFRTDYSVVNLRDLARITDVNEIDPDLMVKLRLVSKGMPVKILGNGEIERAITVRAHKVSSTAAAKIEKAGGRVEII